MVTRTLTKNMVWKDRRLDGNGNLINIFDEIVELKYYLLGVRVYQKRTAIEIEGNFEIAPSPNKIGY